MNAVALLFLISQGGPRTITPSNLGAMDPHAVSDGRRVFVAFPGRGKVYVMGSSDAGGSFSAPIELPSEGNLAVGMRRGPRIAVAGKSVVVSAIFGKRSGGQDGELLAWSSADEGKTWAGPSTVTDVPGAAREGLHAMAASPTGRLACAWLDLREKGTQVWTSTSDDGGKTWSKNVRAYRSPSGTVCECCHPSVAFGPDGTLYVMFRNWLEGSRDLYLLASADGGKSFPAPRKLGLGTWPLSACPMDGGALGVRPDGTVETVWRRRGTVYRCVPGEPEVAVGEGTQPWMPPSGGFVVWRDPAGDLRVNAGSRTVELARGDTPSVVRTEGGALVFWANVDGVQMQAIP